MTIAQIELVKYWFFLIAIFLAGLYISYSDIENKQVAFLIVLIPFSIVSLFQDFSYYAGFGDKSKRIGAFVEKHPFLKLYLVIYCATVLPFMIYRIGSAGFGETSEVLNLSSFFLLIGPIMVVSERERYKRLGK